MRNIRCLMTLSCLLASSLGMISYAEESDLTTKIDKAERAGTLTAEQAQEFRTEEAKIAEKQKQMKQRNQGQLSSSDREAIKNDRARLAEKIHTIQTAEPDNTKKNFGDNQRSSVTPEDQSTTKQDVEITRSIRQKLINDNSLSTNAQNVKIIYKSGVVTLRGPVNSIKEKEAVEAAATECLGNNNQLQSEIEVIP